MSIEAPVQTNKSAEVRQEPPRHEEGGILSAVRGAWSITEDAAIGAAQAVKTEVTEHPWRAAGELAVGAGAVIVSVAAAPEVFAGTLAYGAALGLSEAGAEVAAGLATAGWLTLPYARVASRVGPDTVNAINNTTEDRTVLMHPDTYSPERVAQADASVQANFGAPVVETLAIAGGIAGTALSGAQIVPPIRIGAGRVPSDVPTSAETIKAAEPAAKPTVSDGTGTQTTTLPAEVLPQSDLLHHPWLPDYRLAPALQAQPLSTLPGGKVSVDDVIVGNGWGGLTLADAVAKYPFLKGSRVAVVSDGEIGQFGNSTAAMMRTRILDGDYKELLDSLGPEQFKALLASSDKAYNHMTNLLGDASHPTDSYYFSWTDSAATPDSWLRTSLQPMTQIPGVRYLNPGEAAQVQPFMTGALKLEGEAYIDPIEGLHKIAGSPNFQDNVRLLQGSVTGITRDADGMLRLTTADGGVITTKRAFFATNSPPSFLGEPGTFPDFEPWHGTSLLTRAPQTRLGTANYYDTEDITFFRNVKGLDGRPLVRVGGNAPDTPDQILQRLDPTAEILRRTQHELPLSPDGRPIIGEVPGLPGVYVDLGFNGTGTIGAGFAPPIFEQLLKTGIHPSPKLFGPTREFIAIRPEPES